MMADTQPPVAEVIGQVQSLRTRLGGSSDLREPFPPRPKHMQRKTYGRLRELDLGLMSRCMLGLASDVERLRRRIAPAGTMAE